MVSPRTHSQWCSPSQAWQAPFDKNCKISTISEILSSFVQLTKYSTSTIKLKKIHLVVKVRLILVFPPPTHPETKVWDVGPLLRLGRGGGKAEYRAGWPEAKVILNISRLHFFFRTERISCKPQRTKEIWSENWRRKLLHCSLEKHGSSIPAQVNVPSCTSSSRLFPNSADLGKRRLLNRLTCIYICCRPAQSAAQMLLLFDPWQF